MSTGIPCPNPGCGHVFSRTDVLRTEDLTCPRCGKLLQLRTKAPRTTPRPSSGVVSPAAPPEEPLAFGETEVINPTARVQRAARPRRRWVSALLLAGFAVAAVGGIGAAVRWLPNGMPQGEGPRPEGAAQDFAGLNCRIILPPLPWQPDDGEAHDALKAVFVLRRPGPDVWAAFLARDCNGRNPKPDELRTEVVRRLQVFFRDSLEVQPAEDGPFAGRPAHRFIFRGDREDSTSSGECHALAHEGIAYWFLTWAPADQVGEAAAEFEDMRRRFSLLNEQFQRTAPKVAETVYRGRKVACSVSDRSGLWTEWTPASDHHADADLALYAAGGRGEPVAATALLLVPKGNPADRSTIVKAAPDRLAAEFQKSLGLRATAEVLADKDTPADAEVQVGSAKAALVGLHVRLGQTKERFVLLAVLPGPKQLLVWQCECDWSRRADWEPQFLELLAGWKLDETEAKQGTASAPGKQ